MNAPAPKRRALAAPLLPTPRGTASTWALAGTLPDGKRRWGANIEASLLTGEDVFRSCGLRPGGPDEAAAGARAAHGSSALGLDPLPSGPADEGFDDPIALGAAPRAVW